MFGRGAILVMWLGGLSLSASAGQLHKLRFAQPELVMVWQSGELIGQGGSVPVYGTYEAKKSEWLGSGYLLPIVSDAETQAQSVTLDIASNSGFAIKVRNAEIAQDVQVRIVDIGINAKRSQANGERSRDVIYRQTQKTAQRPGAPETQALSLELTWSGENHPSIEIVALTP